MASNNEKKYWILIRLILAMIVAIFLSIGSLTKISNRQTQQDQFEQELIEIEGKLANYLITSSELGKLDPENLDIMKRDQEWIKKKLEEIGDEISKGKPSEFNEYKDLRDENEINWSSIFDSLVSIVFLDFFSNEALLGILLVSCGIIGSGVSAMRSRESTVQETSLILGAAVGFISLLFVKSGSGFF